MLDFALLVIMMAPLIGELLKITFLGMIVYYLTKK